MAGILREVRHRAHQVVARHPLDIAGWNLDELGALRKGCWDGVDNLADALQQTDARLVSLAGVDGSSRVLDAGCGYGLMGIYLAQQFGCESVGITLVEDECTAARKKAKERGFEDLTRFEVMDFTKTSFESESFDVVFAIESLTYLEDKTPFLAEAFRLLRPGGRLVVADQYRAKESPSPLERRLIARWSRGYGGFKLTTTARFVSAMESVGLSDITVTDWTKEVLPSSKILFRHSLVWSVPDFLVGKLARSHAAEWRYRFFASSQAEFLAFRFGVGTYCVVSARKP